MTSPLEEYVLARHRQMRADPRMLINQVRRRQDRQLVATLGGLGAVLGLAAGVYLVRRGG